MPLHTWSDASAIPTQRIWQYLRTMRHSPPGRAAKGARKETFNGAVEQAEQLFAAAKVSGPASRPLLVFYGTAQLGRAVAAVSTALTNDEYRLSGHGLADSGLEAAHTVGIAKAKVRGQEGAFSTVARALDACSLSDDAQIGELWGLVPDGRRFALPGVGDLRTLGLEAESSQIVRVGDFARCVVSGLPYSIATPEAPDRKSVAAHLQAAKNDLALAEELTLRLAEYLVNYPSLSGWSLALPTFSSDGVGPSYRFAGDGLTIGLRLPKGADVAEREALQRRSFTYHQFMSVYPALDSTQAPAHPLLLWWAILYALSKLARYYPREWLRLINVSEHPDAASIEYMLNEALVAVPEIACSTIEIAALDGSNG